MRHLLSTDGLDADTAKAVLDTADELKRTLLGREVRKLPTLRGRTVVTLFYENSTRTRVSFEIAGKWMSADVINVSASSSSVGKGESLRDTALTLAAAGASFTALALTAVAAFIAATAATSVPTPHPFGDAVAPGGHIRLLAEGKVSLTRGRKTWRGRITADLRRRPGTTARGESRNGRRCRWRCRRRRSHVDADDDAAGHFLARIGHHLVAQSGACKP